MNELVFVHDHIFFEKENEFFSGGGLPDFVWKRYLHVFTNITVIGRRGTTNNYRLVKSSHHSVSFALLKNYRDPKDLILRRKAVLTELESLLITHKYAIIRLPSVLGVLSVDVCRQNNIPYLIEAVGSAYDSLRFSGLKGKIFGRFLERKMKSILKSSDFNIYVTEKYLQNTYPSNGTSVAISNVMISNTEQSVLDIRCEKIKSQSSGIKIGLIGSLSVPYKGHRVLLEAVSHLLSSTQEMFELFFVGGGDAEPWLNLISRMKLNCKVHIIGTLKAGQDILDFLDSIDIYIHPSLTEGLPRVVLEAFSRGCPVLGSNAGGIPELLSSTYIHEAGNAKQLAAQLQSLVGNKRELQQMAISNFDKAKEFQEEKLNSKRTDFLQNFKYKSAIEIH